MNISFLAHQKTIENTSHQEGSVQEQVVAFTFWKSLTMFESYVYLNHIFWTLFIRTTSKEDIEENLVYLIHSFCIGLFNIYHQLKIA